MCPITFRRLENKFTIEPILSIETVVIELYLIILSVVFSVTSSEKVDKENRYAEFSIASIPYPGCEFFKNWKDSGYRASGLMFDWNQVGVFFEGKFFCLTSRC